MNLHDAKTVITGASGGIGPAIARACRHAGSQLIVTGRNQAALRVLGDELDAKIIVADLTNPADIARLAAPIRDAGMWADTGLAPTGLRTKSPADVGSAVVRAIEPSLAQVCVAPIPLRLGARLARMTPATFARIAPKLGARRITDAMADAL